MGEEGEVSMCICMDSDYGYEGCPIHGTRQPNPPQEVREHIIQGCECDWTEELVPCEAHRAWANALAEERVREALESYTETLDNIAKDIRALAREEGER